jgi:hypothetical protein
MESMATVPKVNGAGLVGKVTVTRPPIGKGLVWEIVKPTETLTALPVSLSGADAWLTRATVALGRSPVLTVAAPLATPVSMSVPVAPPLPGVRVVMVKLTDRPATCGRRTDPTATTMHLPAEMPVPWGNVIKYGTVDVGVPTAPIAPVTVVDPLGRLVVQAAPCVGA